MQFIVTRSGNLTPEIPWRHVVVIRDGETTTAMAKLSDDWAHEMVRELPAFSNAAGW